MLLPLVFAVSYLALSQQPVAIQRNPIFDGVPSSGGYTPPALSLTRLLESDLPLHEALMTSIRTGDQAGYRNTVLNAARAGDLAAELLLGEQYIPEQCTFEPNQDVPYCGKNGNEPPKVVFRTNLLGIDASYEEASQWLEKASAQGSGEASEVLAQLITRMRENGHTTRYTPIDATRLHALARSQGFDVEPISVNCYKLIPGADGITLGHMTPEMRFTAQELEKLSLAGVSGSLLFEGGSGSSDSTLLMRPEGPVVHLRVILDHDPNEEVLLPMPAHRDEIDLQHGEEFLALQGGDVLPRFVVIESSKESTHQVTIFTQLMDGGHSGGSCARFP